MLASKRYLSGTRRYGTGAAFREIIFAQATTSTFQVNKTMFVDARTLDNAAIIEADICIIGGGIAGITLALEFGKRGIRTCVLESGGLGPDRATRDLYRGENIGLPYRFDDPSRSRFLGGSSNCWGGWCRPMEEHDFTKRDWVPYSGWPFEKSELLPFYDRSRDVLKVGPNRFDAEWTAAIDRPDVRRIPLLTGDVVDAVSQFSPPLRFGRFYRKELRKTQHVTVFLYANVVEIETDPSGQKVQAAKVATLTGRVARATAKAFILAAGGIENARLLLVSNQTQQAGLGNGNDLVGRFFMDHPQLFPGQVRFNQRWARNRLFDEKYCYHNRAVSAHGICVAGQLMLSPKVQAREKLLNAQVWFNSTFAGEVSEAANALTRVKRRATQRQPPGWSLSRDLLTLAASPVDTAGVLASRYFRVRSLIRSCRFHVVVEPAPHPESRVTLSDRRDQLGMNRVRVRWHLDPLVKQTVDRTCALIAEEITRAGVADVALDPPLDGGEWPSTFSQEGTWHHMGTTRMHDSPKWGVVDRNCRVHGIQNLYVSGSSVFPTAGGNFPTITIVALALRLSDHIATELCRLTVSP
jgi:choline dehydrogenase-like flavoprotein